jgi:hypothetical protein
MGSNYFNILILLHMRHKPEVGPVGAKRNNLSALPQDERKQENDYFLPVSLTVDMGNAVASRNRKKPYPADHPF